MTDFHLLKSRALNLLTEKQDTMWSRLVQLHRTTECAQQGRYGARDTAPSLGQPDLLVLRSEFLLRCQHSSERLRTSETQRLQNPRHRDREEEKGGAGQEVAFETGLERDREGFQQWEEVCMKRSMLRP